MNELNSLIAVFIFGICKTRVLLFDDKTYQVVAKHTPNGNFIIPRLA
jgi:hypothetical protein